jgi:hypothetical protein
VERIDLLAAGQACDTRETRYRASAVR